MDSLQVLAFDAGKKEVFAMEDRVKELLDRMRETGSAVGGMAVDAARCAGHYAGRVADGAKLSGKRLSLKSDMDGLLCRVGKAVYARSLGQEEDAAAMDALLAALDEKRNALDAVYAELAQLHDGRACPACGALCGRDDRFCKDCGVLLDAKTEEMH